MPCLAYYLPVHDTVVVVRPLVLRNLARLQAQNFLVDGAQASSRGVVFVFIE